jgi:hypothetical protein
MMKTILTVSIICVVFTSGACVARGPEIEVVSSANSYGYAVAYPATLKEMNKRYVEHTDEVRKIIGDFATYDEGFLESEENWQQVLAVVEGADRSGRSRAYVTTMKENQSTEAFFEEEKEAIARRISNNVKTGALSSGCTCEIKSYGRVIYSLRDAVNDGLETRLQENSEAHQLIERHKTLFGKKNTEVLEREAVRISKASYLVYVMLPNLWKKIERLLGESREVSKTLDDALKLERESLNEESLTKSERDAVKARISDMEIATADIDVAVDETRELVASAEIEIPQIRQEYEDAFEGLCNTVFEQASESSE